jgi:SH3 domain-containing YSC84-like protein 1
LHGLGNLTVETHIEEACFKIELMIKIQSFLLLPILVATPVLSVQLATVDRVAIAEVNPSRQLELSAGVLEKFVTDPKQRIPASLIRSAQGIAVIPNVVQAGFVFGGRRGSGVLMVRDAQGNWGNPAFVTVTGGSFGLQIGAQSSDVILIFRSRGAVTELLTDNFSLGGNVSVAAGPIGGDIVNPNSTNAQVFSYARNEGLFAGVALEGAKVAFDPRATQRYYNRSGLTARRVFNSTDLPISPEVEDLREVLSRAAGR